MEIIGPGLEEFIPQLKLNKLKKLEIWNINHGEEHTIKKCVDTFPTLTHFRIKSYLENDIFRSLKFISNLKNLKYLGFKTIFGENYKQSCDSLERMANKCQKLKSIKTAFPVSFDNSDIRQLLSPFKALPALKRLYLTFDCHLIQNFHINQFLSFEAFKDLSNITHLTLRFKDELLVIEENILTDIDIILPKLQYLRIVNRFHTTPEEVTQMADILSRLSRLQTLKLAFSEGIDYNEIEEKIGENCRKIQTIDIQFTKLNNYE